MFESWRSVMGRLGPRSVAKLLSDTYHAWRAHRTVRLGAGIAYYGLFAIVPLLGVSLSIAGVFVSEADIESYLAERLGRILDANTASVESVLSNALPTDGSSAGLGIISTASLIVAASFLVVALQDAFNTIWERPVRSGWRVTVSRRLVAFVVVISSAAYVVAALVLNSVTALLERVVPDAPVLDPLTELFGFATSWALGVLALTLLLRYLTVVRVPWPSAIIGGAITAAMVAIGAVAIGAYLRRFATTSLAGATGSIFLFLIWMYYEAQIVLAGAELTRALADSASPDQREPGASPGNDAAVNVLD